MGFWLGFEDRLTREQSLAHHSWAAEHLLMQPKVFISYSWTSPAYQEEVMTIADRLMEEGGIDVVIDDYDLKEGQDVNVFMERLKHDESLHFCLILSDSAYARKANERKKGVGTEAQIISKEIYDSVDQTRFVPVVMENDDQGKACLPTFLQSRKFIDFSSPEKRNQNWERLVRLLHGKPARVKPAIGSAPTFLDEKVGFHFVATRTALASLRIGLMEGKPGVAIMRDDVLDSFVREIAEAADSVNTDDSSNGTAISRWESLLKIQSPARDLLVDWMLVEAKIDPERAVTKCIVPLLEKVFSLPFRPEGIPSDHFAEDAMACLAYELALYAVACLIDVDGVSALKMLIEHPFLKERAYRDEMCAGLIGFYHYSSVAETWNRTQKPSWISPLSQLFKERATHDKINFDKLVEAEALLFLLNLLADEQWYPNSAVYIERNHAFVWFMKAKAGRTPDRLALLTGRPTWESVRDEFLQKLHALQNGGGLSVFRRGYGKFLSSMGFAKS